MKWHSALASLVILILSVVSPARAVCPIPELPEQNLQHSDVVFSGEVITIEPSRVFDSSFGWILGDKVTFTVLEAWKGVETRTVTLEVPSHSESYTFVLGQHYLVYADYQGRSLTTHGCKGNKLLADAQHDLQALGPGSIPSQPATEESDEEVASGTEASPLLPATGQFGEDLGSGTGTGNVLLMLAVGGLLVITLSIGFFLRQRRART